MARNLAQVCHCVLSLGPTARAVFSEIEDVLPETVLHHDGEGPLPFDTDTVDFVLAVDHPWDAVEVDRVLVHDGVLLAEHAVVGPSSTDPHGTEPTSLMEAERTLVRAGMTVERADTAHGTAPDSARFIVQARTLRRTDQGRTTMADLAADETPDVPRV